MSGLPVTRRCVVQNLWQPFAEASVQTPPHRRLSPHLNAFSNNVLKVFYRLVEKRRVAERFTGDCLNLHAKIGVVLRRCPQHKNQLHWIDGRNALIFNPAPNDIAFLFYQSFQAAPSSCFSNGAP